MDPSFSYAIRTSDCKSHRPPCGPGITLRQEYEYLSNQIIRLRSILLETDILDENTYTDDIIQRNLTDLLFQIEKVILDMKDTNGIRKEYRRRYTELRCHLMNIRRCRVAQHNEGPAKIYFYSIQ